MKEQLQAELGVSAEEAAEAAEAAVASDLPDLSTITADEEQRIVKLQANAKGYLHRKKMKAQLAAKLEESGMAAEEAADTAAAAVESGADLPDLASFSAEDAEQITKIQANARGFLQRKKMKQQIAAQLQADAPGLSAEEAAAAAEQVVEGAGAADLLPDLTEFTDSDIERLTKLQAASRGYLARKAMADKTASELQAEGATAEDAKEAVKAALPSLEEYGADAEAAAVKLQAASRGHLARRRMMEAELQAQGASAAQAKAAVEASFTAEQEAAAVKIQARSRGITARREVQQKRVIKASYAQVELDETTITAEQQASIVKIQAVSRGKAVRKEQARARELAQRLEAEGMAAKEAEKEAAKLLLEKPELEAGSAEEEIAVLKIQAAARGRAARKEVATLRAAKEAKSEALPSVSEYDEAQTKAAVKIQAAQRGKADRKRVLEMRLASQLESEGVAQEDAAAAAAAAVKESGDDDLPDLASFSAENVEKLTKVQAGARGYLARKAMKQRLAADMETTGMGSEEAAIAADAAVDAAAAEGQVDLASFSAEDEAKITKVQAAARGKLARMQSQRIRAELVEDLVKQGATEEDAKASVQAAVEEAAAAGALPDLMSFDDADVAKVTKIQAAARGRQARLNTKRQLQAKLQAELGVSEAEAAEAAEAAVDEGLPDLSDFNEASVVKMQANARGFLARKQLKARIAQNLESEGASAELAEAAAAEAVSGEQMDLTEFTDSDVAKVTKIQAAARGRLARLQTQQMVQEKLVAQGASADDAAAAAAVAMESLPDLDSLTPDDVERVTKLQAHARGHLARKQIKAMVAQDLEAHGVSAEEAEAAAEEAVARNEEDIDLSQFSEDDVQRMVRIQAAGRGMLARKAVKNRIADELEAKGATRAEAEAAAEEAVIKELPDLESFTEADKTQIARIQAGARGYLARKQVKAQIAADLGKAGASAEEAEAAAEEATQEVDLSQWNEADTVKLTAVQARARGFLVRKAKAEGRLN